MVAVVEVAWESLPGEQPSAYLFPPELMGARDTQAERGNWKDNASAATTSSGEEEGEEKEEEEEAFDSQSERVAGAIFEEMQQQRSPPGEYLFPPDLAGGEGEAEEAARVAAAAAAGKGPRKVAKHDGGGMCQEQQDAWRVIPNMYAWLEPQQLGNLRSVCRDFRRHLDESAVWLEPFRHMSPDVQVHIPREIREMGSGGHGARLARLAGFLQHGVTALAEDFAEAASPGRALIYKLGWDGHSTCPLCRSEGGLAVQGTDEDVEDEEEEEEEEEDDDDGEEEAATDTGAGSGRDVRGAAAAGHVGSSSSSSSSSGGGGGGGGEGGGAEGRGRGRKKKKMGARWAWTVKCRDCSLHVRLAEQGCPRCRTPLCAVACKKYGTCESCGGRTCPACSSEASASQGGERKWFCRGCAPDYTCDACEAVGDFHRNLFGSCMALGYYCDDCHCGQGVEIYGATMGDDEELNWD